MHVVVQAQLRVSARTVHLRYVCPFGWAIERRGSVTCVAILVEHCCQVWVPQNKKSLNAFDLLQRRAVKWILKEPYKSYSDEDFLNKQRNLELLPMKFKFVFSDIVLFYKISNKLVNIDLPNYVTRIEPQDVKKVTRSTKASADGIDKSKYRCKVMPKVNSFRDSYFYRTSI